MRRHASRVTACGGALLFMVASAAAQTSTQTAAPGDAPTVTPITAASDTQAETAQTGAMQPGPVHTGTAWTSASWTDDDTAAQNSALTDALNAAWTTAEPMAREASTAQTQRRAQATAPAPEPPSQPITDRERADWVIRSTVGLRSLGVGVLSAGWNTAWNRPEEYHGTWEGFGKRYMVRLSGVAIGNGMEAGLGTLWGEDPRYTPAGGGNAWQRIGHAARMTVMAYDRDGELMPAYARYAGTVGNNFITNAWRPDSENSAGSAMSRSAIGITGRFASNLFEEFWPDLQRRLSRKRP